VNAPRPLSAAAFREPNRDFGILPFWFLNGELDPEEMKYQLGELRAKQMQGVIFHGRYGLEMPYLSDQYLERIKLGVEEANRLGLQSWIYDEMNWPSGTADKRVLKERPDLAQRYLEFVSFEIDGPWFMCLTGEDSRYLDFERSTPVAVFAIAEDGSVRNLTSNLSFEKVVPWEVPPGHWRLCYIVEKRADYYIDALDPEATQTFIRLGYDPYVDTVPADSLVGFYSDEPAMHYYLTAGDNPIVPWTKDMFRRFQERNGYDLRSRLLDLFIDVSPDAARTRYDYYNTTTEFYSDAYYKQLREWCRDHGLVLTAHLLYEEWIRQMVRVEGNPFRHYENMDVVAVDHLYPVIGTRESPDQHVAIKLASSAAHHFGSERLICESFGGIFMDATMQRMKWITDWEAVLGVNVINPHGFHYTFEGARKRDWPPSMFYQYPWWSYYEEFSSYVSRVSEMLTGGRHVAKVAVLWPINAMFASYLPSGHTEDSAAIEGGLNRLTDSLLRLHHDFDYLDEEVLAGAEVIDGKLRVANEDFELVLVPPMSHIREATIEILERFAATGGRVLGVQKAPEHGFGATGMSEVGARMKELYAAEGASFLEGDVEMGALDGAIRSLIEPDIEISSPEIFVLHRRRDDSDIYFLVNTTFEVQEATVTIHSDAAPVVWDPTSGDTYQVETRKGNGGIELEISLPPVGSTFLVTGAAATDAIAVRPVQQESVDLDGAWTFTPEGDNALVIKSWKATPDGEDEWLDVIAGAWAYQLPAEPQRPWPIPVRYRVEFDVDDVPDRLALLEDGFAGSDIEVWLNGEQAPSTTTRSAIDSQMRERDLSGLAREGRNALEVRMVLESPTGGLVDHVKLLGSFEVADDRITARGSDAGARSWTEFGYPFFSGKGVYRTTFAAPESERVLLSVPMVDDVVEVEVNGRVAGVRIWDPYVIDITSLLQSGDNELALRVANTPANLLNGDVRPSGLAGTPRLLVEKKSS
jgi:alpha-L-rhamnosidase